MPITSDYLKKKYGFVPKGCFQHWPSFNEVRLKAGECDGNPITQPLKVFQIQRIGHLPITYMVLQHDGKRIPIGYLTAESVHGICEAGWDQGDSAGESLTDRNCALLVDQNTEVIVDLQIKENAKPL